MSVYVKNKSILKLKKNPFVWSTSIKRNRKCQKLQRKMVRFTKHAFLIFSYQNGAGYQCVWIVELRDGNERSCFHHFYLRKTKLTLEVEITMKNSLWLTTNVLEALFKESNASVNIVVVFGAFVWNLRKNFFVLKIRKFKN
jgi:hypothetical protein